MNKGNEEWGGREVAGCRFKVAGFEEELAIRRVRLRTDRPTEDAGKVKRAGELQEQTPMSLNWDPPRLEMGSGNYVANLLRTKLNVNILCKQ